MTSASLEAPLRLLFVIVIFMASVRGHDQGNKQLDRDKRNYQRDIFTTNWAVEIVEGGEKMAEKIADKYGFINHGQISGVNNVYHFELRGRETSRIRTDSPYSTKSKQLLSESCIGFAEQQIIKPRVTKSYNIPTDPLFQSQWNLVNTGQHGNHYRKNDLNVERAWLQGLSGCNVTVTVVDDGLDLTHRDLWENFVPQISFNFLENDTDPSSGNPWHGTSCGGIIGSAKDNDICGVGVAYNSNLGGLALLGANSDMNEAKSLTFKNNIVDIYSNSWGPFDSGNIVDGPGPVAKRALQTGIQQGRGGKGSIFVWANGNGGSFDNCAADGYASSIYTISIGAIGVHGEQSPFDEECSAKMIVTYVTDFDGQSDVSTTALNGECTTSFGGTSAATPMAAGIIALALEANTNLTWRDVQYLIVYTANPLLTNATTYTTNGAGLMVSHQYGFGVMDAEALVTRARYWVNVPPQLEEHVLPSPLLGNSTNVSSLTMNLNYSGSINYLEHVIIQVSVNVVNISSTSKRGDIEIELVSPSGTHSKLLGQRVFDYRLGGYFEWPFMSVMFWGENPTGEWNLTIYSSNASTRININDPKLKFYGVSDIPEAVSNIPDTCHPNCARGCAKAGSGFCDSCINLRNAYTLECIDECPSGYSERNGYCFDPALSVEECNSPLKYKEEGSCVDSGFTGCCTGEKCEVVVETSPLSCYCDSSCYIYNDCCDDIVLINCYHNTSSETEVTPYVELWVTDGVETLSVPQRLDDISPPINVQFPFGLQIQSTIYVGTNGYFTFREFTGYTSFVFDASGNDSLVAPFFTDIDISIGVGQINYEIHTRLTSQNLLSKIDSVVNEQLQANYSGRWMLVAEWNGVPQYGGDPNITNTFQAILTTDFARSYAVFIYYCGDLGFSNRATIGYITEDGMFANHEAVFRDNLKAISCLNMPATPWVNVVYQVAMSENECEVNNGGCEHICSDTFYSFECSCKEGYSLDADGVTCKDINECSSQTHGCSQICVNTIGSYMCECNENYGLDDDGRSCSISCGGTFTAANGTFHTPDWPLSYPALDFRCEWLIDIDSSNDAAVIEIAFHEIYGIHGKSPCPTDYVQVFEGIGRDSISLGKHCFLGAPDPIVTPSSRASVIFQASSNAHLPSRVGVSISYSSILKVNECETDNGGCEHGCRDTLLSFECFCNGGYELDTDSKRCIDTNECSTGDHDCEDICINTEGSYTCSCRQGYELSDNGHSCTISCGGRYTESNGTFHSPDWPLSYPSLDFRCEWIIDLGNNTDTVIDISFHEIYGIHGRNPCPTDYVQVLDDVGQDSTSLGKYCYLKVPDPIITSSSKATIVFQASRNHHLASRVGVSISYKSAFIVNECEMDNGGCEHQCVNTFSSYHCTCHDGYTLDTDSRGCIDIDECSTEHNCEHVCVNTDGSYKCACRDGYALDSNGRTCSISCGGILSNTSGSFQTPDWPHRYPQEDFTCVWTINPQEPGSIRFVVDSSAYGINGRPPCAHDHIEFFEVIGESSRSLGRYCRLSVPEPITVQSEVVKVVFEGRRNRHRPASRKGVRVTYQLVA